MYKIDEAQEKKEILRRYRLIFKSFKREISQEEHDAIHKAFVLAVTAHGHTRRKSGEPYIYHPLEVAHIVVEDIGLGPTAVVCALLHDVVEDTEYTLTDIENGFGPTVARIVDGLTKIDAIFDQNQSFSIQAENFNVAEHFAFHSQYPYMFYGYGNKVYTHQLGGTDLTNSIELPAGEEVTMVKIDLWKWLSPSVIDEDKVPEQHYVLVGSYNSGAADDNGGILRRYRLNNSTNNLELVDEWSGFAKIVDVCYRERW